MNHHCVARAFLPAFIRFNCNIAAAASLRPPSAAGPMPRKTNARWVRTPFGV